MKTYMMRSNPTTEIRAIQLTEETMPEIAVMTMGDTVLEHDAIDPAKTFVGINFTVHSERKRLSQDEWLIINDQKNVSILGPHVFADTYIEVKEH